MYRLAMRFIGFKLRAQILGVMRCDAESLHDQFGPLFQLVDSSKELHQTPFGTTQRFSIAIAQSNDQK